MKLFKYSAKNQQGELIKGKVEALAIEQASHILTDRGLLVIQITPVGDVSVLSLTNVFNRIKRDDVVNFTRQLATMIDAGLPIINALSILEEQSNKEMGGLIAGLIKEIEGGNSFSKALEKSGQVFSRVYVQLVKAGELGGMLDRVLNRLAETMEKDKEFQEKTKGALIYPTIVFVAMLVVAFVMMVFVVPQLTSMYQDFGAQLPLATQILINVSNAISQSWPALMFFSLFGFVGLKNWQRTVPGERVIDSWLNRIPVYGQLRTKIILTEFSRTLALLLGAGVSLIEALTVVGEAMDSILLRESIKEVTTRVEKGVVLSQALARYSFFPPILYQMIAVGEETGKLTDILLKISSYFESESEHAVKNLTTALEPIIMIVLGLGVGIVVVAIIMPIYSLTSQF